MRLHDAGARLPDPAAVQDIGAEALTRSEPRITVEASGVVAVHSQGDRDQAPPVVVLHVPKITCPMVMVAADSEIDLTFVAQPPTDTTFTIRSVTPTACR